MWPKLVRDKIPDLIAAEGKVVTVFEVKGRDRITTLAKKLSEEALELDENVSFEEMADVMEVYTKLLTEFCYGQRSSRQRSSPGETIQKLFTVRLDKLDEKGGFDKMLLVIEVNDE